MKNNYIIFKLYQIFLIENCKALSFFFTIFQSNIYLFISPF